MTKQKSRRPWGCCRQTQIPKAPGFPPWASHQHRALWTTRPRLCHLAPSGGHTDSGQGEPGIFPTHFQLGCSAPQVKSQGWEAATALCLAWAHSYQHGEAGDDHDCPSG